MYDRPMTHSARSRVVIQASCVGALLVAALAVHDRRAAARQDRKRSQAVFSDYREERPGVVHRITVADLPAPFATPSVDNPPTLVPWPDGAVPHALPGYSVTRYAGGLENPRLIRTAPNGDLFVAESRPGRVKVVRGLGADGRAQTIEVFASGLTRPFGIAFYPLGSNPKYVYVANTNSVVRFPYQPGDLKARGPQETVVAELPSGGQLRGGGHWTRDIAFSRDGRKMYVSVGSLSNNDDADDNPAEKDRATILEFNPDGSGRRIYVSGIRNAVGLAIHPQTGQLWASVNERDGLGDNLVPDYITRIAEGEFYGWPWFYMGGNQDPRHQGKHPELKSKVKTPDVLIEPHTASLQMVFYAGRQFPARHRDSIFAAQHGSWNKSMRTGYKVIRVPLTRGVATGEYEDFLTGFVTADGQVWGRPVGVAVTSDGALLVSDDGSNAIWRVSYDGRR
jgi:glucose/arabinose dehydrogenase